MRVENTLSTPAAAPVDPLPVRAEGYSLESILIPPQAPTFPRLSRFFNWLWSCVRPLFSLFSRKKETPPPPDPDVLRAIHAAQVKKNAPYPIVSGIKQMITKEAIFSGALAWYYNNFPSFAAQQSVKATTAAIEYTTRYIFPTLSSHLVKGSSLAFASVAAWHVAERLGYPMGKLYLFFTALNVFSVGMQALAQRQADQKRRFRMRMAGG